MAKATIHNATEKETIELKSYKPFLPEDTRVIEVILSERNLLSLFSKLYIEGSKKTIYNDDVLEGHVLKLVVQDDESHYKDRAAPGVMHPATEELVSVIQNAISDYVGKKKVVSLFKESVDKTRGEGVPSG